jgi:phenylacetate-coenzyme A ligase PaaK-like adenylate-forming protein
MRRHAWRGGRAAAVELSVIVPCYDEEGNLPELVERTARVFEQRSIAGEIVLVNDGSRDGTAAQIDDLARRRPDVVAVHHATNLGIPAGWRSGFERSRGRYVCTIDADLQYQPEAIAVLHREMCAGRADVVQGWRSPFERRRDHRYFLSRGLDVLLRLTFALPGRDVKSGFVLCRREVFEDVLSDASRFHYFQHMITVVAKARGYSIRQVETLFADRRAGRSFITGVPLIMMWRTLVDVGRAVVAYRLRERKDPSLETALATGPGRSVEAASRRPRPWRGAAGADGNAPGYLNELERTQWLPRAKLERLQLRRVRRMLAHAAGHVGYWREVLRTARLTVDDVRTLDDLRHVPVLTPELLRENIYFDLLSDSRRAGHLAKCTTSGTAGEPRAVFLDRLTRDTRWANLMRHRGWAGLRAGEGYLRLGHVPAARRLPERLREAIVGTDVHAVTAIDAAFIDRVVTRVRSLRPAILEADAEVLRVLATAIDRPAREPWVRAVVATGQTLADDLRHLVERRLGARVLGRYAAREVGPVAQECEAGRWHVNAESCVVEIERDGRPVAEGEPGEIVVTDLTNRSVPLIRYRVGDVAAISGRGCACGRGLPVLERLDGRPEASVVVGEGRCVPSSVFGDLLAEHEFAVRRWQVVQRARDHVVVRVVRSPRFGRPAEHTIRRVLGAALGRGVVVELAVLDELPGDDPRPVIPLESAERWAPRSEAASAPR